MFSPKCILSLLENALKVTFLGELLGRTPGRPVNEENIKLLKT
jgi:hypothetical protein